MKFQFGPSATPPLIKLTDHGILGLQYDTFHFTDYDHYGEVRHSITAQCYKVKEQHFNCMSNYILSPMLISPLWKSILVIWSNLLLLVQTLRE